MRIRSLKSKFRPKLSIIYEGGSGDSNSHKPRVSSASFEDLKRNYMMTNKVMLQRIKSLRASGDDETIDVSSYRPVAEIIKSFEDRSKIVSEKKM